MTESDLATDPGHVRAIRADLSTYEGRQTACSILKKEIDALRVLVNNASTNKLIPTLSVSSGRLEANRLVSLQCGQQSD
jgi:short-subunit dehydrogenase